MSALNQGRNLNIAHSMEYVAGVWKTPPVALTARRILPSYSDSELSVSQVENIQISVPIPSILGSGVAAYGTASGSQGFNALANLNLAPWDNGQIVFHNISVVPQPGTAQLIVGHPQLQLVDANENVYPGGMLRTGFAHRGLSAQATVSLYSPNGSASGNVLINLSGLLVGMAVNH